MSKESMNLGEAFQAKKISSEPPEVKPRHYWIGWLLIASLLGGGGYFAHQELAHKDKPAVLEESPGFKEILGKKFGGVLYYDIIRSALNTPPAWSILAPFERRYEQTHFGPIPNTIVNEGENTLEDCFEANTGSACTQVALWKFHGLGTSSAAIAETDGGCTTELTTQYTGDVRATGTQTNNGANIYRTVATNTIDSGGPVAVEEFCLMDTNTGAGLMWTRILTGTITLQTNDSLATTYDLTIE